MDIGIIFIAVVIIGITIIVIRIQSFQECKDRKSESDSSYGELKDRLMADRMRRDAVSKFNRNEW